MQSAIELSYGMAFTRNWFEIKHRFIVKKSFFYKKILLKKFLLNFFDNLASNHRYLKVIAISVNTLLFIERMPDCLLFINALKYF